MLPCQLAALVLTKLPREYDIVSRELQCRVTKDQLDFDDLSSLLVEEESVLLSQGKLKVTPFGDQALIKQKKCQSLGFNCGKKGHL